MRAGDKYPVGIPNDMVQFYITTSGIYDESQIEKPESALVVDVKNQKLRIVEQYEFLFMRLSNMYQTQDTEAKSKALSQFAAKQMYDELRNSQ